MIQLIPINKIQDFVNTLPVQETEKFNSNPQTAKNTIYQRIQNILPLLSSELTSKKAFCRTSLSIQNINENMIGVIQKFTKELLDVDVQYNNKDKQCQFTWKRTNKLLFPEIMDKIESLNNQYVASVKQHVLPHKLISNLKDCQEKGLFTDVTLEVKGTLFFAHKVVLTANSVFCTMLTGEFKETNSNKISLNDPFFTKKTTPIFLDYLYTGITHDNFMLQNSCLLKNQNLGTVLKLGTLAKTYDEIVLQMQCHYNIVERLSENTVYNVLQYAVKFDEKEYIQYCQDMFTGIPDLASRFNFEEFDLPACLEALHLACVVHNSLFINLVLAEIKKRITIKTFKDVCQEALNSKDNKEELIKICTEFKNNNLEWVNSNPAAVESKKLFIKLMTNLDT